MQPTPDFLQVRDDLVFIAIKVQPRAARNEIVGPINAALKIKITAPPVDSAANDALLRFLSERLHCPRGAVQIVRGQKSRHKIVSVHGLDLDTIRRLLS
jgi:uncharacterized protein (TIGR00251 family)